MRGVVYLYELYKSHLGSIEALVDAHGSYKSHELRRVASVV